MKHIVFDCDGTLLDTSGNKYKLFPGIKELLKQLVSEHQLYVWTGRGSISTRRFLEEEGIFHLFEGVSTADDAPAKPFIGGLVSLLGNTAKNSICVIGDSSADMLGAKSFGVLAIGAVWNSNSSGQVLKDFGADFIVSHPFECSKLIAEILGDDDV